MLPGESVLGEQNPVEAFETLLVCDIAYNNTDC